MIGDIYQMLNNQDTSVCTVMPQIKGPFLCQCRCLNYCLTDNGMPVTLYYKHIEL